MYTLFDIAPSDKRYGVNIPKFTYVKKVLQYETQKVYDYHHFYKHYVKPNHLLAKLLFNLNVSYDRDIYSFVSAVQDRTERLAKVYKLIHPTNQNAERHQGIFYNQSVNEYLIANDEPFNIAKAWELWENVVAVKIHAHHYSDVSLGIPNSKYPLDTGAGNAVISINVALLALQYRAWRYHLKQKMEHREAIPIFLYNYVFVNMLKRHVEICVINRTINTIMNRPVSPFSRLHPLFVYDMTTKLDEVIALRAQVLTERKADFKQLFLMFDPVFFSSWAAVLKLPNMAPTRNTRWVYLLSYLPYLHFYLTIISTQDARLDRHLAQQIKRHIGYMENTKEIPLITDEITHERLTEVKQLLANLQA